jgi:hypothetical protein
MRAILMTGRNIRSALEALTISSIRNEFLARKFAPLIFIRQGSSGVTVISALNRIMYHHSFYCTF